MQIEGKADDKVVERITKVITDHYEESSATLVSLNITHIAFNEVYIIQAVFAYESDDEFRVTCETVRVDVTHHTREMNFTLLNEVSLDLTDDVCSLDLNYDSMDMK